MKESKIGFGGGCHWCTEAVFQSIIGVLKVEQGWISSVKPYDSYSEGVIVHYNEDSIDLRMLSSIHLKTHSSTSNHSRRGKYRSAIYVFADHDLNIVRDLLKRSQSDFDKPIITQALLFGSFKLNTESYLNYYKNNRENQFCQTYIEPKLGFLNDQYASIMAQRV